jgi:hypothetical protein
LTKALPEIPRAHLILIPKRKDRERAIVAFFQVRQPRCRFSGNRFLVTAEHLEALHRARIPFEDITEPPESHG